MQIKEIKTTEEISQTFGVLSQIYQELDAQNYVENVENIMKQGYKMAAVYENLSQEDPHCIGVIGVRAIEKLYFGKILEIEDFMIDRKSRGIGVGKMLLRFADWQATVSHCNSIVANIGTQRLESQKIFSREKFVIDGFAFCKNL